MIEPSLEISSLSENTSCKIVLHTIFIMPISEHVFALFTCLAKDVADIFLQYDAQKVKNVSDVPEYQS